LAETLVKSVPATATGLVLSAPPGGVWVWNGVVVRLAAAFGHPVGS